MNDELIEKCRKLLALGNSCNQHEAELAIARAHGLAVKHGIDLASIEVFGQKNTDEKILRDDIFTGQRLTVAQKFISNILQDFFNVKIIYTGNRYLGRKLVLLGTKTDIELANYANQFLNRVFVELWHEYYKNNTHVRLEEKNSFFFGLSHGLRSKLVQERAVSETEGFEEIALDKGMEQSQAVREKYAVMVISKKEKLVAATREHFPKLGRARHSSYRHSGTAIDAGVARGKTININKAIGHKQEYSINN